MQITITDLELWVHIGITDEERTQEQRILATATLTLGKCKALGTDRLEDTVDFNDIAERMRKASKGEWRTVERLVFVISDALLELKGVACATLTVKKIVLPGTKGATVTLTRP